MLVRPALLLATLLASVAFAGCSTDDGTPERGGPLPALSLPWSLTDCRFAVILVDVPAERVQPHVPEGFRVLSVAEVGLGGDPAPVPDPAGGGNFGLEVFQCDSGQGLDGPAEGLSYGSYFTAVEPPADLRRDVDYHFVKWDTLVPDTPRRVLLQGYGLPVRDGLGTVETEVLQGPLTSHTGTLDFFGEETVTFEGQSLAPQEPVTFVEYTRTSTGLAAWSTTMEFTAGGPGPQTVVVPSAGKATDVLGSGMHRGIGYSGIATFSGGLIEAPAQP